MIRSENNTTLDHSHNNDNDIQNAQIVSFSNATTNRLRGSTVNCTDILDGNRAWVEKMNSEDPDFFNRLGMKQEPLYLYIGCCDARVDPSRLMGFEMGKLFVHRNIGNVVSCNDLNILSVVDYAVNTLQIPHIFVVGHYDCGAVRGCLSEPEYGGLGIVENWLCNIRDVARIHKHELSSISECEKRHRKLVELNIQEQCLNILKIGTVQQKRIQTFMHEGYALPRVHGFVFDPKDGILQKLPLDFKSLIKENQNIYDLYRLPKTS
jgi:carbonic anhydrase